MKLEGLRAELVDVLGRVLSGGLVLGSAGNASARDPDSDLVVASPTGIPYERMRPEDVSVVTMAGDLVQGQAPTVELAMHLAVLAARPEVGAVVHTHSPYATALACVLDEIPVVAPEQAAAVGGPIPVAPYVATGTAEMGEAVAGAAGERWAAIVRNHGPVCLGRDLEDALRCAFAVEESAQILWLARSVGEPALLPEDEIARVARLRERGC